MSSKELVATSGNIHDITPLDQIPDYLGDEGSGLENIGRDDLKIPRIKILQGMSPEVRKYPGVAIPGMIWHSILNKPIGAKVNAIVLSANRKVFVWLPKKDGGDLVAVSMDGKNWDKGANTKHKVISIGKDVVWNIGNNVSSSKLLDFGSSNPDDENSPPAASLIYEYLLYLPDFPEYSPCVFSISRSSLAIARNFNTLLVMTRKPSTAILTSINVSETSSQDNTWFVPQLSLAGYVSRELYETAKNMKEMFKEYTTEIEADDHAVDAASPSKSTTTLEDEIPF